MKSISGDNPVGLRVSSCEHSGVTTVENENLTFYPLRRESRWSKDHDKLPQSAMPPMNGSEEAGGPTKGSTHQ